MSISIRDEGTASLSVSDTIDMVRHRRSWLTAPQVVTLLASLIIGLGSGTTMVYSGYAPQMGEALKLSHTQLNLIGVAGNMGAYSTGPLWGHLVDTRGPPPALLIALVLLLGGYAGTRLVYLSDTSVSTVGVSILMLLGFAAGAGGKGGITSAMNATAKKFPDTSRGTATGVVLSGYGLSALLFSTAARGHASTLLLCLTFATPSCMLLGLLLLLPNHRPFTSARGKEARRNDLDEVATQPLLSSEADEETADNEGQISPDTASQPQHVQSKSSTTPNVHGKALLVSLHFWVLFAIVSTLSGTGLMYINNVGVITQSLLAKDNDAVDPSFSAGIQSTQVSLISATNFSGRILIGFLADLTKSYLHRPRSYCMPVVALAFLIALITAATVSDAHFLWIPSLLLGLAYGALFALGPTIAIEWFGLPHFSENWGYAATAPLFGGTLFGLIFGQNLDAHDAPDAGGEHAARCTLGRECYVASVWLAVWTSVVALLLSIWSARRDGKRESRVA